MKKITRIIIIVFALIRCSNQSHIEQAKDMADQLLKKIATGNAIEDFSEKYFPHSQAQVILHDLQYKCDFANRKGRFINDFQTQNETNRISFIYEYYLKCDSVRFILTYNLGQNIELYEFKLEPINKKNFMITKPERQLKF